MKEPISLHVLCRREGVFPKGVVKLEASKDKIIYDSVSWRVKEHDFEGLKGKPFFLHDAKNQLSYRSGVILYLREEAIPDNDGEMRAIVKFEVTKDAPKPSKWPDTDNPNEYCRVNYDTPLDQLRQK
ncbi:MAG: hypothetical protein LBE54_11830 [Brucellaceae bacterium]|jgi:hypothetical protein|nr:hypothetical protein [Brucellaceae bacterium]